MPNRHLLWGAAVAALFTGPALAAEADGSVEEVVVTATRDPGGVAANQTGASINVITPQDIEDRQVRIVSDVLRDVPGVAVSRTGAVGNLTQVRVRGTEGNHVLTLIDGIKASDPFAGEFDWATLIADDLAKVEVLRGQQSALYGSDAIGGVINYITPSGAEAPGGRVRIEGGSMGTYGGAARFAGVQGGLDYALSAGYQHTDGYPVATVGTRDIGSTLSSIAAKAAYQITDGVTLRGILRHTTNNADMNGQDFGTTGFVLDSPGSKQKARNTYGLAALDWSLMGGAWTGEAQVQGVDSKSDTFSNFERDGGDKGTRLRESLTTSYRIEAGELTHTLTAALDHERETYQNTAPVSPFGPDTTKRAVHTTGLVAQYDLTVGQAGGVRGAVRHDDNQFFKDATTYRVEGWIRATDALRLRAAAGSGVKGPSQTELFGFNAGTFPFVGNPNLKPERSEGWEAGADLTLMNRSVRLAATYFDSVLHDEIISIFGAPVALCTAPGQAPPASCSTTGNAQGRSTQKGVELWGEAQLGETISLDAAYTYLNAKQEGVREVRRPKNIASLNATWRPVPKGSVTLTVRYNGPMTDTEFANFSTVTLKSYTLVNLGGSYQINEHLEVYGRIENLTDENYFEVVNFRTPGRAAYAGVRARF